MTAKEIYLLPKLKPPNSAGDSTHKTLSFLRRAVRNRKFPELARAATVANGIAAILTAFERAALRLREIRYL